MASTWYKYGEYLSQNDSAKFDAIHKPGASTPDSGIYRCEGCSKGVASNAGK